MRGLQKKVGLSVEAAAQCSAPCPLLERSTSRCALLLLRTARCSLPTATATATALQVGPQFWAVHRVVNRRLHSSKRPLDLYEVKWLGFGDGHNTWEKRDSFLHKVRRGAGEARGVW